jgi:beta-carotene hydroxylase
MNGTQNPPLPKLPDLGSDLLQVSRSQKVLTLAYPFLWCGAYFALAWAGYWPLAVLALVCLSFVTYGSTSHDLVHRNLGLSGKTNDVLLTIIELLAIRSGHAYQAAHLHHHRHFPDHDDIEATAARRTFLGAVVEGFVFQFKIWFWAMRHAGHNRVWILCEGIACLAVTILAVETVSFSPIFPVYVILMIMESWTIPVVTSYLPHAPDEETELFQTRVFRGTVASVLAVDHLYHLEHHLYPAVPHTNWPMLAKRLDHFFQEAGVKPVIFWF